MNWYVQVWKRWSDFQGRSRRKEYWMWSLANVVIALAATIMFAIAGGFGSYVAVLQHEEPHFSAFALLVLAVIGLYSLATIVPQLAVTVRRFHDVGRSGWWVLALIVLSLIPFIGFLASIAMLVFEVLDSQPGGNQWGPNPKEDETQGIVA